LYRGGIYEKDALDLFLCFGLVVGDAPCYFHFPALFYGLGTEVWLLVKWLDLPLWMVRVSGDGQYFRQKNVPAGFIRIFGGMK
jgi:hypothetical protein